jgi:hypothetical protein
VDPTRRQLKYSSNTQYSLPPEIILLKCTNRDVNNTDEKECPATNHAGERIVSLYSIRLETGFGLQNE